MKRLLCTLVILAAALLPAGSATAPKDPNAVTIRGTLPKELSGATLMIARVGDDHRLQTVDVTRVIGGKFRFTIPMTGAADKLILHAYEDKTFAPMHLIFWAAPGREVRIEGSDKNICAWRVTSDIPEQVEQNYYEDAVREGLKRSSELSLEMNELFSRKVTSEEENKAFKVVHDSLRRQTDMVSLDMNLARIEVLKQRDFSPIWLDVYSNALGYMILFADELGDAVPAAMLPDLLALYDRVPPQSLGSEPGRTVAARYDVLTAKSIAPPAPGEEPDPAALRIVGVGDPIVDSDLYDLDGEVHHLADFAGKYLLLDFWAYWCGPCTSAIPEMGELAEMYGDKVEFVSICRDGEKQWRNASAQHGITWHNYNVFHNGERMWASYAIQGIPHYVLVAPDGTVMATWTGYSKGLLTSKLAEFIEL